MPALAKKRKGKKRISTAVMKKYAHLFGGKIPAEAWKLIHREYAKNPGGPGAFERCVRAVAARGGSYSPRGVCAAAGRKKYGKRKFQAMALAGKKRARGNTSRAQARKKGHSPSAQARKRRQRRNPEEAAAERYEFFHGRAPGKVTEVTERIHEHGVLSGIGKLLSLTIVAVDGKNEITLGSGWNGALLAQNEKGTQLFITGGNQAVNLSDFGISHPHENEILGAATEVVYHTQKDHLRPEDGGKGGYHHRFGKGGSRLPMIVYDGKNKRLHFAGGGYDLPEVGIRG